MAGTRTLASGVATMAAASAVLLLTASVVRLDGRLVDEARRRAGPADALRCDVDVLATVPCAGCVNMCPWIAITAISMASIFFSSCFSTADSGGPGCATRIVAPAAGGALGACALLRRYCKISPASSSAPCALVFAAASVVAASVRSGTRGGSPPSRPGKRSALAYDAPKIAAGRAEGKLRAGWVGGRCASTDCLAWAARASAPSKSSRSRALPQLTGSLLP